MALAGLLGLLPAFLLCLPIAKSSALPQPQTAATQTIVAGNEEASESYEVAAQAQRVKLLEKVGVEAWHARGLRGKGVKVAILDSGFRGYRDYLGKTLPAKITVKSFRSDGNLEAKDSQHGILCGEVIHSLAPDADLLFANWESDTPEKFLEAVRWAKKEGAKVISCSMIMPAWGDGEGGGPIHAELTRILGSDMLCVASAGNTAKRHWYGAFQPDANGCHEWRGGCPDNYIAPSGEERVSVELTWKAGPNYVVVVYDDDGGAEVARSKNELSDVQCSAAARFKPAKGHTYRIRVQRLSGEAGNFHCVCLGGNLGFVDARGSVCFPADGTEVLAVGAVDGDGKRLAYSSCGGDSAPKPEVVAPVPFPSLFRERPFAGTSAAAPQAAALAALWYSRNPSWGADKVRSALCTSARCLGTMGMAHNVETGYGLIQLPKD
jgi:subtilisin family serine protease